MTDREPGSALDADPGGYPPDLSPERLRHVVARLAADEYTGRRIGTPAAPPPPAGSPTTSPTSAPLSPPTGYRRRR